MLIANILIPRMHRLLQYPEFLGKIQVKAVIPVYTGISQAD
jgi:hypothetical protein